VTGSTRYRVPYLPVGASLGQEELAAVARVLSSDATLSCGVEREHFEEEFAAYVDAPHAVAVASCTAALELATHLIGLHPGDEIIATPQTYQATIQALLGMDIRLRFCDIDPDTLNVNPESFAALVTPRTRALYLVHYGGDPAAMDEIMAVAEAHGIVVVEDCAHALGATYKGRAPGVLGDIGCFSFQSYKNITTLGEGGMLTFRDDHWATVARRLRAIEPDADFQPRGEARLGPWRQPDDEIERHAKNAYSEDCVALRHPGTNSTLPEPAAAVGRVQLCRLDRFIERRRAIAHRLDQGLRNIPGVRVPDRSAEVRSAHHLYTCFLDPAAGRDRDEVARHLDQRGVQVQLRYFPLHLLPEWRMRGHGPGECPNAERIWFYQQINLPIYPQLEDWQVDYMIEALADAVVAAERPGDP